MSSPRGIQGAARAIALLAAFACAPISGAHRGEPLAEPDFIPPAPGTYTLHRIMAAPEGRVLGIGGRPQPLSRYTRDQITLLGFIYTTCTDPEGCPLAYRVFDALRKRSRPPRRCTARCGSSRFPLIPRATRRT